jgi:hypothetical protein
MVLLWSPALLFWELAETKKESAMTITLNDEQARLLSEVVKAGAARSPEEAVDQAVRALHSSTTGKRPVHQQVDNLADLFAKSPFHGLDMDFERDKDTGRDIAL